MTNAESPAYPISHNGMVWDGLTKREYFAAMAMQGILASNRTQKTETSLSKLAVYYADALIKALNENQ